jgi:hypothetical protein
MWDWPRDAPAAAVHTDPDALAGDGTAFAATEDYSTIDVARADREIILTAAREVEAITPDPT